MVRSMAAWSLASSGQRWGRSLQSIKDISAAWPWGGTPEEEDLYAAAVHRSSARLASGDWALSLPLVIGSRSGTSAATSPDPPRSRTSRALLDAVTLQAVALGTGAIGDGEIEPPH